MGVLRFGLASLALMVGLCGSAALCDPADAPSSVIPLVELGKPFGAHSPWRFTATQDPPTEDYGGNPAPGALHMCLRKGPAGACVSGPVSPPPWSDDPTGVDWAPHYLRAAEPVFPSGRGAAPLLEIVTGSLNAGNGSQVVATQLLNYSPATDSFERVFVHLTGTNNNQEVRFIAEGPLMGAVISAEPTDNAPFGYWIVVSRFTPQRTYRQVLRYRSATRYGDGNLLAVIDSEMPNIERHLGLWKPGSPLPLPDAKPCLKPSLKHMELWCG